MPLKWNVPNGSGGWISSLAIVSSVKQTTVACQSGVTADEIEAPTSGATSLRYDTTANQYIYNWQSPKTPGRVLLQAVGEPHRRIEPHGPLPDEVS